MEILGYFIPVEILMLEGETFKKFMINIDDEQNRI